MPLFREIKPIAAKIEATAGTPETLAAADGSFNIYNLETQGEINVEEREDPQGFGRRTGAPGQREGTWTFRTDMQWNGTATLPDWAETLFPACGFVKSGNTFTPRSEGPGADVKTLTMGTYIGGEPNALFKSIAGAVGNFTLVLTSGMVAAIDWEFRGVWQTPDDVAMISPIYPVDEYLRFADAVQTFNTIEKCVQETQVNANNTMILRECHTEDSGYISGLITGRRPLITTNPEAVLVATDPVYTDWQAGTEAALNIQLKGPNTSTLDITAPKAQYNTVSEGEREGLVVDEIEFACNKNGTVVDEELSITFTPTV